MVRNAGEAQTGPGSSRIRLARSRSGPITDAVRGAVREARDAGRITAEHLVNAALAERLALLVDAAWRADDAGTVIRATSQLRDLLDVLPIRSRPVPDVGKGTDDTPGGTVLQLLDGPPVVGDSA